MEKFEKYVDNAVLAFIEKIKTEEDRGGCINFYREKFDIKNILNLFDRDQLLQCSADNLSYVCVLLEDGSLLSFMYFYTIDECHIFYGIKKKHNMCTVKMVGKSKQFNIKFFKIVDKDGKDVIGPFAVHKDTNLNLPLNKIMRPVSLGQLYARGILGCNGGDYDDGVIYDLVMQLNGKLNSEIVEHDENMEQSGLFKIFDEDQMILTETESGVETCLVRLADKILRIVCIPPVSNNGKNQYYMAFYSDPEKYMVKPTILENERISIEITRSDVENTSNDEEKAFLEIPEMILKETKLTEILKPISYEQLIERIKNILHKTK